MARQIFAGGSDDYNQSVGWRRRRRNRLNRLGAAPNPFDTEDPNIEFPPGIPAPHVPSGVTPPPPAPITYDDFVKQFTLQPGRFENMFGDLLLGQGQRLQNAPAVPTFEEMFESFRNAQQREEKQALAGVNELYGSRGARYGSDIGTAQNDLRLGFQQQNDLAANKFLMDLENQRQNFLQLLFGGTGQGAALEEGRRALGEQRSFADFLRQTSPPPLFGAAVNYAGGSPASQIIY